MNDFFGWLHDEVPETEEDKIRAAIKKENRYILYWKIFLGVLGIVSIAFLVKCS